MPDFQNRNFLITGGASGIGLATARLLQQQGANLVLWDVNETALQAVATELTAQTAVVDITDSTQVQRAMQDILSRRGVLHGVVHCAGILRGGLFQEIPLEMQRRMVEINLIGSLVVLNAAVPHLIQSKGSFIFLSSISAFYGPPEFASYAASKAGVLNLAQSMRLELEASGVHVGVVCPFFVATPMIENGRHTRLFQRFGVAHTPEEVALAILKGIGRRRFMIWPNLNPAFFYWFSHVAYPLSHWFMRMFWKP